MYITLGTIAVLLILWGVTRAVMEGLEQRERTHAKYGDTRPERGGLLDWLDTLEPAVIALWVIFLMLVLALWGWF